MQNLLIQIDSLNQQRHQLQPLSAALLALVADYELSELEGYLEIMRGKE